MNTRNQTQKSFVAVLLLLAILGLTAPSQSAELGDFLPEVQLARSVFLSLDLIDSTQNLSNTDPCDPSITTEDLPVNLWVADSGKLRTDEEVFAILTQSTCAVAAALSGGDDSLDRLELSNQTLFQLAAGEVVPLPLGESDAPSGLTLDGSKQSIRHAVAFPLFFGLTFELFFGILGDQQTAVLGGDQCGTLKDFALNGPTLEVRWAAFLALASEFLSTMIDDNASLCLGDPSGASEAQLLAAARLGDLKAALELAGLWNRQVEDTSRLSTSFADVLALKDEVFLRFTTHFGEPLVTLAATIPYISLKVELAE